MKIFSSRIHTALEPPSECADPQIDYAEPCRIRTGNNRKKVSRVKKDARRKIASKSRRINRS